MWLKRLENNNKKNSMFLDFGFEALCWGDKNNNNNNNNMQPWEAKGSSGIN